jgi:predicted O-linked N-acetylglucosamine transferase (SPINDLY family)
MTTPPDLIALAIRQHRSGDSASAEQLCHKILQADATHADAWHLLGVLATRHSRREQALDYLGKALALQPDRAAFHLNRGVALQALGRLQEAAASFGHAVRLQPDLAEAHNNLANALHELGQPEPALTHWRRALELRPGYAEAHHNLAQVLHRQGQYEQAEAHARHAVRLQPHAPQAHYSLGNALAALEQFAEAAACYEHALRLQPAYAEAHCNLGHVLHKQRQHEQALAHLRQALSLQPNSAAAHNEVGAILGATGNLPEAEQHLRQALWAQPDYAEAHVNLAVILREQRRLDDAVAHLRTALRLQPELMEAYEHLATTLTRQQRTDEALECLREGLRRQPGRATLHTGLGDTLAQQGQIDAARAAFTEALRLDPKAAVAHSCLLNNLHFDPTIEPAALFAEHRRWAELHAQVAVMGPAPDHDCSPDRRLRIGYLSEDFRQHVLAHFVVPILANHDPAQVETTCYADVTVPDGRTAQLHCLAHRWRSLCGRTDAEVAQLVRDDAIDILVDLGGHTGTRLGVFARQPAPVQVTYLGYPNTTGLTTLHYRLTDAVADPPEEQAWHTEQLLRLPGSFCCYEPPKDAPAVSPLPVLSTGVVTFGSLHKLAKLNGEVLDLWSRLLHALPGSRLLIFRDALRGSAMAYFREQFARRGLTGDRVLLRYPGESQESFLKVYGDIDILLDVFPWSGHATACEALWMGVPVLTLRGARYAGSMVASVLTQVGLPDLIARTPDEYVAKAVQLANDQERLVSLRSKLRDRMRGSPLCDGKTFTRHLEEAYRGMWHPWVKQGSVDATRLFR